MKKPNVRLFCLLLSLLLLAPLAAAASITAATPLEAALAYQAVLRGEQSYIRRSLYEDMVVEAVMTGEIADWYGYAFDTPLRFTAFAVTDLDLNGDPELLLQLSQDFGYELLRYDGGQVYGYGFVARAMEAVTLDGEIHGSSGAENFGWYRVEFSGEAMRTAVVCWKYDEESPEPRYMIGDTQSKREDFEAMNAALWGKEPVRFTEYSPEAVAQALAGF